ncbi:MAG: GMC family oxidoreductase N-terminal domain-containing protein [Proteobacteria bacterium]|nr:GMC family oxidoreductase N-terminal domain-containing protein [Pseudomonadota bacterium]
MFDYVIVGGGSAGCVLASRLSADPSKQVALLEAGPDTPPESVSSEIYAASFLPHYFGEATYWTKLEAYLDPVGNKSVEEMMRTQTPRRYEQARIMGGGSTVNGQVAIRGLPGDYDEWEAVGAEGWNWRNCLPYFKRLERDMDFDGPMHGKSGPIPIRRCFPPDWGAFSLAFRDSLAQNGIPYYEDCHAEFGDGCFPFPRNNILTHRVSTAIGYLDSAVRLRRNLTIMPNTALRAIAFDGNRAVAVQADREGAPARIEGREIVVCAGALHSPAILMRAGIGPGEQLQALGIAVRADRPGVGANLLEHPLAGIGIHLKPEGRLAPTMRNNFTLNMRFSSGLEGCPGQDMKLSVSNRFAWSKAGAHFGTVQFGPNKSYSQGFVRLRDASPASEPIVAFNLMSDPRDLTRMMNAVRFVIGVLQTPPARDLSYAIFPGVYGEMIRNLMTQSKLNTFLTDMAATMLNMGGAPRRFVTNMVMKSNLTVDDLLRDDAKLEAWIRQGVQGDWHACGTCKMGAPDDRAAVVDPHCRVYGVEGLRVVDASVMPTIPAANTNISTIMIAEKMSDAILGRPVPAA